MFVKKTPEFRAFFRPVLLRAQQFSRRGVQKRRGSFRRWRSPTGEGTT